jgi:predicted RNA-binding protein
MCESNAYMINQGSQELLMESVTFIKPEGERVFLKSLFGEEKSVQARIVEMDLGAQKILLESN